MSHSAAIDRFIWRDWPDGSVVFDRRWGNTHTLNGQLSLVLRVMLAEPDADLGLICAKVRPQFEQMQVACIEEAVVEARAQVIKHVLV